MKRRQMLKGLSLAPPLARWSRPLVLSVVLPAHAQSSVPCWGIATDISLNPQIAANFSCRDGVAKLTFYAQNYEGHRSTFFVSAMTLSNPNHQLIVPATFPVPIGPDNDWDIEIRENVVDCAVTAMSPGTLSVYIIGCPSPFIYDVEQNLLPLHDNVFLRQTTSADLGAKSQ